MAHKRTNNKKKRPAGRELFATTTPTVQTGCVTTPSEGGLKSQRQRGHGSLRVVWVVRGIRSRVVAQTLPRGFQTKYKLFSAADRDAVPGRIWITRRCVGENIGGVVSRAGPGGPAGEVRLVHSESGTHLSQANRCWLAKDAITITPPPAGRLRSCQRQALLFASRPQKPTKAPEPTRSPLKVQQESKSFFRLPGGKLPKDNSSNTRRKQREHKAKGKHRRSKQARPSKGWRAGSGQVQARSLETLGSSAFAQRPRPRTVASSSPRVLHSTCTPILLSLLSSAPPLTPYATCPFSQTHATHRLDTPLNRHPRARPEDPPCTIVSPWPPLMLPAALAAPGRTCGQLL